MSAGAADRQGVQQVLGRGQGLLSDELRHRRPTKAPDPLTTKDPNFGVETEYYEDTVTFAVPVKVMPQAPAGKSTLTVQVRFQTCNDRLCLPPRVVKLDTVIDVAAK